MSELGSGSGSSYPGSLDTDSTVEVDSPSASKTLARIAVPNDLAAAIVAIETELGTDPAGTAWATVVLRLAALTNVAGGVPRGLASARPTAAPGVLYYETDTGVLNFSDGTTWRAILTG